MNGTDESASVVVGCGMVSLMQKADVVKLAKDNDEPHGGVASLRKYMKSNASLRCGTRGLVVVPAARVNAGTI